MHLILSYFKSELYWLGIYVLVKMIGKFFQLFQILLKLLILMAQEFQMEWEVKRLLGNYLKGMEELEVEDIRDNWG